MSFYINVVNLEGTGCYEGKESLPSGEGAFGDAKFHACPFIEALKPGGLVL